MLNVSVSKLKAHLSRYVEAAANGGEIVITDRGKPVAMLRPVRRDLRDAWLLSDLVKYGRARPAYKSLTDSIVDAGQPHDQNGTVMDSLLSERNGTPPSGAAIATSPGSPGNPGTQKMAVRKGSKT